MRLHSSQPLVRDSFGLERSIPVKERGPAARGRVSFVLHYGPGHRKSGQVYRQEALGENLVVDLGRATSARLLGGGPERNPNGYTAPQHTVNFVMLGGDDPAPPTSEEASDTALDHPIVATWKAIGAVVFPNDPDFKTVRFSTIYAEAEANFTLNEAGLYIGPRTLVSPVGATLYARKIFGDVTKTADFLLTLNWDIEF